MKHKHTPEEIRAAFMLIERLSERWPKYFFVFERRRVPLKIGVHHDILAAFEGAVAPEALSLALSLYTHNLFYQRSVMRAGTNRIDLEGGPCGVVTEPPLRR
jgi:sRNA-binding protein